MSSGWNSKGWIFHSKGTPSAITPCCGGWVHAIAQPHRYIASARVVQDNVRRAVAHPRRRCPQWSNRAAPRSQSPPVVVGGSTSLPSHTATSPVAVFRKIISAVSSPSTSPMPAMIQSSGRAVTITPVVVGGDYAIGP